MAKTVEKTQSKQLQQFRVLLGESTFQRIQRKVWNQFSPRALPINSKGNLPPLAIFEIWDELIHALRQAARRLAHERELASRIMPTRGPLWELLKNGVQWSATLDFLSDHQRWEVVITRNRERSQVQQFVTREKADAWADKECVEIAMGWKQ